MDYHVDLNYNNNTVYNVIDDLATWNEYFEAAQLYAENNRVPYDVALKYIVPIYFKPDKQENEYHKLLYLVIEQAYEADNNKPFMTYKEWCDVNGYKIQE
mgnify:FL=1